MPEPIDDSIAAPAGEATLRTIAMPADANPNGDIFGGWLLSQMDLAGSVLAKECAQGRVATVAIDAMKFHKPVLVGDEVSCYCRVARIGRTSITVAIESWVRRSIGRDRHKVTEGIFIYVALDDQHRPRPVAQN
jgi:acyl-CoA thioesterase YciA